MQRIEQLEETRDDSSKRLHLEIDEVKRRVEALNLLQVDTQTRLTRFESTPIEVDKIRFPPRIVAAAVAAAITIVGGMYASTYGLRSDVRDILTTIESQKREAELTRKLADQQTESLVKAVDVIDKRQQLQAIQMQELKEMVIKGGR